MPSGRGKHFPASGPFAPAGRHRRAQKPAGRFTDGPAELAFTNRVSNLYFRHPHMLGPCIGMHNATAFDLSCLHQAPTLPIPKGLSEATLAYLKLLSAKEPLVEVKCSQSHDTSTSRSRRYRKCGGQRPHVDVSVCMDRESHSVVAHKEQS